MSEITVTALKQKDDYITKLTHYICPTNPKASILLLHGMAEHQKRYQDFANFLVNEGYDVYTYDHRGHGINTKLSELGFFSAKNGHQLVTSDAITVCDHIQKNGRSSKVILFGHSMGSFIARNVIQTKDSFHGVILCGTGHPTKPLIQSGLLAASFIRKLKGPKHISPFISNLMFGGKKYTSLTVRTAYDWLTRNNPVVGAYIHDPYCGFTCTASFYHDLFKLIQGSIKKAQYRSTNKELPLFIISGDRDPVCGYGKEFQKFISFLKKLNFVNISSKLYPECRHELLNELNNKEVYSDILNWIEDTI